MNSSDYIQLDDKYSAHNYLPLDVVVNRAEGVWVYDVDGNKYLDCLSAYSAVNQGHCHPTILRAAAEQMHRVTLTSRAFRNDQMGPFLKELCDVTGYEMALPMNTGAEAVETAIKAARKWGYLVKGVAKDQAEIIVCEGNFHGRTTTIVGFSSEESYKENFGPFTPGFVTIPYGDAEALEAAITPATVAFLFEPIQGEGGYIVPAEGFFPALRKLCDKHGILLIADEVQSGMGRTGKWWAIEHFDVIPDIIITAKGIASGIPLGAIIAKKSVMTWPKGAHGNTYGGNPVASAAAIATIDLIEREYLQNATDMGQYMIGALEEIKSSHDSIGEVRGIGLMLGVDFVKDHNSKKPDAETRDHVERLSFEHGLVSLGCGKSTIRFAPPLSITKSEIDEGLQIFNYAVGLAEKGK